MSPTRPDLILDDAHLADVTDGCAGLQRDLLRLWAEAARGYATAFDPDGDTRAWREAVHAMRGAAGAIGAAEVLAATEAASLASDALGRSLAARRLREATERSVQEAIRRSW